jgi:peroxiredoxin
VRRLVASIGLLLAVVVLSSLVVSAARVGDQAPAFSNVGTDGKTYSLEALKGKWVVLEWYNPGCPFTQKHYGSGNMPRLQREWTAKGVVWLTVSTSAPAEKADAYAKVANGAATAILMDLKATTAMAYTAKTSPHMFVIDPKGALVYNGAIDDKPTPDPADVVGAKNFVAAALTEGMAGRPITTPTSRPYGCVVKYPSSGSAQ